MTLHAREIQDNLRRVQADLAAAAERAGRDPADVRLLAVSKTMPAAAVQAAYDAGHRAFGENRSEEIHTKRPALPADIHWHMIGTLQSRQAADAVPAALIHSVDRAKLLPRLATAAAEHGLVQDILLQVNVSGEASKSGVSPDAAEALLLAVLAQPNLRCRGLMTMAPFEADEATLHRVFAGLRTCRDRLQTAAGVALPELSMGMSGDYPIAVAEGATLVRIGTAIFGHR